MEQLHAYKQQIRQAIESHQKEIIKICDDLMQIPELGYKENKSSAYVKRIFSDLGFTYEENIAITGVKATLTGKQSLGSTDGDVGHTPPKRPLHICFMGELDAVGNPAHPYADSDTGAAHACGHNVQIGTMLAVAYGFAKSGLLDTLGGKITFMAVPAEECIDFEYRNLLIQKGQIEFPAGKQQIIADGELDDIDICMMAHALITPQPNCISIHGSNLGFVTKQILFKGKPSHAAASPDQGVNALNAAMIAIMSIHALRETFRDEDHIRIHPIITKGGDVVNVVPCDVRVETLVRGKTKEAILDACQKVDNCIRGACLSIGTTAEIHNMPGYLPMKQDRTLGELFAENFQQLDPALTVMRDIDMFGSSDIGDVSQIRPTIQPTISGFTGSLHGEDFAVTDIQFSCIKTAIALGTMIVDLLVNNAALGHEITEKFEASFTIPKYLEYLRSLKSIDMI